MREAGSLASVSLSLDGNCLVTFALEGRAQDMSSSLQQLQGKRLIIDAKQYRKPRSLNANAYLWQLIDKMAKRLGSDKWTIYLLQIARAGVFTDLTIVTEAEETLKAHWRYVEILRRYELDGRGMSDVRCYYGSSTYDSEEMSHLLQHTIDCCRELGIDTMTPDEVRALISAWKGGADAEQ